jgi:hypothetical protein
MYRGSGRNRTVFERAAVAKRSQRYAKIIATARAETRGRRGLVRENTFTGRAPLEVEQPSRGARQLRRCLVERVEPSAGRYTRLRAYRPYRFPR